MLTGQEIRKLRDDTGLSVNQFCQFFGVTPSTVTHWETDRSSPSVVIQTMMIELRGRIDGMRQMMNATDEAIKKALLGILVGGGLVAVMTWLFTRNRE
jgi:transcriptional regulator with XRE-family HTH domain